MNGIIFRVISRQSVICLFFFYDANYFSWGCCFPSRSTNHNMFRLESICCKLILNITFSNQQKNDEITRSKKLLIYILSYVVILVDS